MKLTDFLVSPVSYLHSTPGDASSHWLLGGTDGFSLVPGIRTGIFLRFEFSNDCASQFFHFSRFDFLFLGVFFFFSRRGTGGDAREHLKGS